MTRPREVAAIVYGAGLVVLFMLGVWKTSLSGFPLGGPEDFTIFYMAGQIVQHGDSHLLYDLSTQATVQQGILEPHRLEAGGGLLPFNYPPFFALLFVPFSLLSLPDAFLVWYSLSLILLALAVGLLWRDLGISSWSGLLVALALAVSFLPLLRSLTKGQSSALMLALLTGTYLALKHGRDEIAGVTLAFAMIKPQLALPLALVLVLMRRWRAVLSFAAVVLALVVVSALIVGPQGLSAYISMLRFSASWQGNPGFYPAVMPNIRGSLFRFAAALESLTSVHLAPAVLGVFTLALTLAALAYLFYLWSDRRGATEALFPMRFAASLALVLVLTPHVYDHDLTILIIAGFVVAGYYRAGHSVEKAFSRIGLGHLIPWLALLVFSAAVQAQILMLLLVAVAALPFLLTKEAADRSVPDSP